VAPQVLAGLLGFAAMFFLMNLDYRYLRLVSLALAIVALAMLVIVRGAVGPFRSLSVSHNGSTRWILGPRRTSPRPGRSLGPLSIYLATGCRAADPMDPPRGAVVETLRLRKGPNGATTITSIASATMASARLTRRR